MTGRACRRVAAALTVIVSVAGPAAGAAWADQDAARPSPEPFSATDYFPLRLGNYWTFEGTVERETEAGTPLRKRVRVRMRVVDVLESESLTLVVMEGHPSDASWAPEVAASADPVVDIRPSRYGYLIVANKVFRIGEPDVDLARRVVAGDTLDTGLLNGDRLDFELPLYPGLRFGDYGQLARRDRMYAWQVIDAIEAERPAYRLVLRTLPDDSEVHFMPYRGIVHYEYSHHGTKNDVALSLAEYHTHLEQE